MNKGILILLAIIFSAIGSFIPVLFGNTETFGIWQFVGSLIGGFFGIWLGVRLAKRYEI